ncbi:MAG TPA: hypothetical protein VGQ37_05410 [Vicinamibacterales bacterium]|jgi:hypothetical protein|nr:hypothetical protein [Vicinamibacterales bacterium]
MTDFFAALENLPFSIWLRESNSIWAYPTMLTLHTIGLALLVGASAALDLKVLGWGQAIALTDLRPMFRWMWIGFWVNALSGVVLLAADATTKAAAPMFLIKLGLIAVGVVIMAAQRRAVFAPAAAITRSARVLAAASLTVWFVAIAAGRLMAYPGLFFGL